MRPVLLLLAALAFTGCTKYPTAEKVAACAAARIGVKNGKFIVAQRSRSMLYGAEYAITYQKSGSTDRGIVIYNRVRGPITSYQEISYGNHAEIKGAVEAIEYCASSA
jgi:hypothetical protein